MDACSECANLLVGLEAEPGRLPPQLATRAQERHCRRCIESYRKTVSLCRQALAPPRPQPPRPVDDLLACLRDRLGVPP